MADDLQRDTRFRFFLLFIIWFLCAAIPMILSGLETAYIFLESGQRENDPLAINVLMNVFYLPCAILGTAALVYTFVRYRFKLCWIYMVVSFTLSLLNHIVLQPIITGIAAQRNANFSVANFSAVLPSIPSATLNLVSQFVTIILVRFFTGKFKKEWKIVLFSLLSFFIFDLLTQSFSRIFIFLRTNLNGQTDLLPYLLKSVQPLRTLLSVTLTGVGYCILALLFPRGKREHFRMFSARVRRLWEATAK